MWQITKRITHKGEYDKAPGTVYKAGNNTVGNTPDENLKPRCTMSWGVKHRKVLKAAKVGDEVQIEMLNWAHPSTVTLRKVSA